MPDTDRQVVIIGAGGHARAVGDALGDSVAGHVAPQDSGLQAEAGPWLGDDDTIASLADRGFVFAIGLGFVDACGAEHRVGILDRLRDVPIIAVIHPAATVASSATIAAGAFIGPGAVVGPGASIGPAAIVNSGAVVDHDCTVGRNAHVASGATLAGDVTVGRDTLIGAGATVRNGVEIGSAVVVGAGAVVVDGIAAGATVVGVPARPIELM